MKRIGAHKNLARGRAERGNTLIEFALVTIFLVPMFLGTVNIGMSLSRSIQTSQISRDAGHMYARYVDFSEAQNQEIIVRLASGMRMGRTSGQGKVVLSRVMYVGTLECASGGFEEHECPNFGRPVITQQIIVGDAAKRESKLGEPPANLFNSKGEMSPDDYLVRSDAQAAGFDNILAMQPGELAYVSEAYFESPELDFPGFLENTSNYARTIF